MCLALISYVSLKYIVRYLDPSYTVKQEAKKKVGLEVFRAFETIVCF